VNEFPDWKRRDNFSVDAHQRMIDGLRKLFNVPNAGVGTQPQRFDEPRVGETVVVRVEAAATGGGKYIGFARKLSSNDVSDVTRLNANELGLLPEPDEDNLQSALILNALEIDKDTHDLTTAPVTVRDFVGFVRSRNSGDVSAGNAKGKWVVVINGIDWENCT
jgi:hypothetical protein